MIQKLQKFQNKNENLRANSFGCVLHQQCVLTTFKAPMTFSSRCVMYTFEQPINDKN